MGRIRSTASAMACAAVLLTPALSAAQGPPADRTTYVTFSGPVSVPGATLQAGTYTFRIADSPANRHIVQVLDRDGSKVFATLLAVAAERNEVTGDPVITFKETPSDHPPAVRFWYYAGEKDGNELVYPKAQAMMIARASGEPVMSVDTDSNDIEAWKKGEVSRVTADAQPQSTTTAAPTTTTPATTEPTATAPTTSQPTTTAPTTSQPTTTAPTTTAPTPTEPAATAPTTSAPAATAPAATSAPEPKTAAPVQPEQPARPVGTSGRSTESLPRTASERPLIGLIGLLALFGAGAAHVARKAIA